MGRLLDDKRMIMYGRKLSKQEVNKIINEELYGKNPFDENKIIDSKLNKMTLIDAKKIFKKTKKEDRY